MKKPQTIWKTGVSVGLLVGMALACTGIREDELACEDAVSHLQKCCDGFTGSSVSCMYDPGCGFQLGLGDIGGGGGSTPDFDVDESTCIRKQSCSELQANGVCERALAFTDSRSQVCP